MKPHWGFGVNAVHADASELFLEIELVERHVAHRVCCSTLMEYSLAFEMDLIEESYCKVWFLFKYIVV